MKNSHAYLLLCLLFIASGCSTTTLKNAERDGLSPLTAREIFDVISGNTMDLSAYDFSGQIYFDADGVLAGIDNNRQLDTGNWDIRDDNSLCITFRNWYYGDIKCYSITRGKQASGYDFFTTNGSAYYRGVLRKGDAAGLQKEIPAQKSPGYLRARFASETGPAAHEKTTGESPEISAPIQAPAGKNSQVTVRQLASNCPGCNLAGADLKEAHLVNADLTGADLSGADLRYANLRRAQLADADLSGARLNHANLPGANLRNSNLRNADLTGANLLLADLTGADLSGAVLINAYLEKTKGLEK